MKKNFIGFSWMFHSSEVHEKPFHRVVPMNRLHFIDLKSNLMGNSYKELRFSTSLLENHDGLLVIHSTSHIIHTYLQLQDIYIFLTLFVLVLQFFFLFF